MIPDQPSLGHIDDHIEVIAATAESEPIFANLLELYAHDFSGFYPIELGEDGRFGYKHLPLYWTEQDRYPFLVRIGGKLAGFVFVKRGPGASGDDDIWDMAEFFIVRRYRRHGVGTEVAHQIWRRFPGRWEVRVMEANHSAKRFWERAVNKFVGKALPPVVIEKDEISWHLFSFESKRDV